MKKLILLLTLIVTANLVHASGLGWSAQSFDWKKYEADGAQLNSDVKKCVAQGGDEIHWCGERQIVRLFIGGRNQKPTAIETYHVKNEVPLNAEYIPVPLLRSAYEIQVNKKPTTLFRLFKNGRTEWQGQWSGCDNNPEISWECTNAYVVMRPNEVLYFKQEIDSLVGKKIVSDYEYFQQDLAMLKVIVDSVAKDNRALLFYAGD